MEQNQPNICFLDILRINKPGGHVQFIANHAGYILPGGHKLCGVSFPQHTANHMALAVNVILITSFPFQYKPILIVKFWRPFAVGYGLMGDTPTGSISDLLTLLQPAFTKLRPKARGWPVLGQCVHEHHAWEDPNQPPVPTRFDGGSNGPDSRHRSSITMGMIVIRFTLRKTPSAPSMHTI